jgi:hypothetical protein
MYITHEKTTQEQDKKANSFIGGVPKLPKKFDIPLTEETQTQMTFFFQYEFPKDHHYEGLILSMFATTDFCNDDFTIPEMLTGVLKDIDIPEGFLDKYQRYFKMFLYENKEYELREDYNPKLLYKKLITSEKVEDNSTLFAEINEKPDWILDDEAPGTYNSTEKLFFLFQMKEDYEFEKREEAPRQQLLAGEDGLTLCDSFGRDYDLFNGNEIYFFGTKNDDKKIYIITQC